MNKCLIIWDKITPLPCKYENFYSIIDIVENNINSRKNFLEFIHNLSATKVKNSDIKDFLQISKSLSFWWMTLLAEKSNFSKSPSLEEVVKVMSLEKWLTKKKYSSIIIFSKSKELCKAINAIPSNKISVIKTCDSILFYFNNSVVNGFIEVLKSLLFIIKKLILFKHSTPVIDLNDFYYGGQMFVSYFINFDKKQLKDGVFYSQFWTELPGLVGKNKIKTNWIHLFVKTNAFGLSDSIDLLKRVNQNNGDNHHAMLDGFISLSVIYKAFKSWLFLMYRYLLIRRSISIGSAHYWSLIRKDTDKSFFGVNAISNLIYYFAFVEIFKRVPFQRKGFYLREGQGWESGLISAWKEAGHGSIIGVIHSTVRYWDLRHFSYHEELAGLNKTYDIVLPDYIAINGPISYDLYSRSGYNKKKLIKVEALRYLYLDRSHKLVIRKKSKKIRLLIFGDYSIENTREMLNLLNQVHEKIHNKIDITFKPHPALRNFEKYLPKLNCTISNADISVLLQDSDVVYASCRTTAAVDAYTYGKKVIVHKNNFTLNSSPMYNVLDVGFVLTSDQLIGEIFSSNNGYEIKNKASFFYLDSDLKKWKSLVLGEETLV